MKKSIKAALFSAFAYPGAGHFYLRQYAVGCILSGAFSVPLFFIVRDMLNKADQIVAQILNGNIPLDISGINESMSNLMSVTETQEMKMTFFFMFIIWGIGIIDSYRQGLRV